MNLRELTDRELFREMQRRMKCEDMPRGRVLLIGPPGSGKSTLASKVSEDFCWCHVSHSSLLKKEFQRKVAIQGWAAAEEEIQLHVQLDLISKMLKTPECARGAVLEGFPQNPEQAIGFAQKMQQEGLNLDKLVTLQGDDQIFIERLNKREVHRPSGRVYGLHSPSKLPGIDDITGEPLSKRADDGARTIQARFQKYKAYYYQLKNILSNTPSFSINAEKDQEQCLVEFKKHFPEEFN